MFVPDEPNRNVSLSPKISLGGKVHLWELTNQLDHDHGYSLCYNVLSNSIWETWGDIGDHRREMIRDKLSDDSWNRQFKDLEQWEIIGESNHRKQIILTATWADLFETEFSLVWIAASALHAHYIKGDDFAFGYLTCNLEQKIKNELDAVRGKKVLSAAKLGGAITTAARRKNTFEVLSIMQQLIVENHSVLRAAELALRRGFGSSAGANRKLWSRHKK